MKKLLAVAALVLAGCATPAKVATSLEFGSPAPGLTSISIRIVNQDDRATTPLVINLNIQQKQGDSWSKPESVLHPVGFVLKKAEQRILRASLKLSGTVRATLTVKEQESGRTLLTQTYDKTVSQAPPANP